MKDPDILQYWTLNSDNPFTNNQVMILDVKKGWVQYLRVNPESTQIEKLIDELPMKRFKKLYKRNSNAGNK